MKHLIPFVLFFLVSCASDAPDLRKVAAVDVPRFMGDWYVIAHIPTVIEDEAHNAVETYRWNAAEERIDVTYRFNDGGVDGPEKVYTQKAWVHDPSGNEWRIQFFWPLKFPYLVIDIAPDYSYTVIGVPNRKYVWIMARERSLPAPVYAGIIERLRAQRYDVDRLRVVPQKL
jgi:apolipoprotein D and lipocalin family protein